MANVTNTSAASGVRWRRLDFHLHSPGVDSFAGLDGLNHESSADRARFAERYAERLAEAQIELAALTDYNAVLEPWFLPMREAARKRGILFFPGVELSVREGKGIHILIIFPEDCEPREINECVRSLDKRPGRPLIDGRTHDEVDLRDPLPAALHHLRDRFGCLIIPAHCDSTKGVVKELGAKRAAELIRDGGIDALEHAEAARGKLASSGVLSPEALANLAFVEFSDPRNLDDVGGKSLAEGSPRGTWLKLSSTNLDAIRLALHDPETRLSTVPPSDPRHPRLISTEVTGSGFLGNMRIDWNPDLNTLVGGRGTGKSAILETLRFALDLPIYSETDYRSGTVRAALGSGGEVNVEVERPGEAVAKRYRVRRVLGHPPEVYDVGSGELLGIAPREVFGPNAEPIVLLQREIQEVSRDDTFRLQLVNVLVGDVAADAAREVQTTIRLLEENAAQLREVERRYATKAELDEKRKSLNAEIEFYESQGVTTKLSAHKAVQQDAARLQRALAFATDEAKGRWYTELSDVQRRLSEIEDGLGGATSRHAAELLPAKETVRSLLAALDTAQKTVSQAFATTEQALRALDTQWQVVTAPLRDELQRLQRELGTKLDSDRYLLLERQRDELGTKLTAAEAAKTSIKTLSKRRDGLLRQLTNHRLAGNRLRRETADAVNARLADQLRITIAFQGQKDSWRQTLGDFFKGSRISAEVIEKLVQPEASDGIVIAASVIKGPEDLAATFAISPTYADRIHRWLLDNHSEKLRGLEVLAPEDSVEVELVVDGKERALYTLSMGQRATAILLLLFALEGRLLILDQPEDDLDNRFVFEDVVTLLRNQKGLRKPELRRQVVAATHNPNIPVLGDAEQIIVLSAQDERAHILTRASIDDSVVRNHVRTVLEGGKEAFKRRAEKYGGIG